jgi:hypothetical protein
MPSVEILKNFFRWYYTSSTGLITENGRMSHDSLVQTYKSLFPILTRETGSQAPKPLRDDIVAYIDSLGAEKANHDKPIADLEVFHSIQRRHWISAFRRSGRGITGWSLSTKMLYFLDCRIGAICIDHAYPNSGLKYGVCHYKIW